LENPVSGKNGYSDFQPGRKSGRPLPAGVNTQKPLHTLRKEYGSLINKIHGIHAASKALRHADISVTNNFYTDSRARVTPGLGKLFARKKPAKASSAQQRLRIAHKSKSAKQPRS
jgi:hypothetical protein